MSQAVPIIIQAASIIDELDEMIDAFSADGSICPVELVQLNQKIDEANVVVTKAELAYSWGMAVLKGGIDGKRAKELELETTRFEDRPSAA